MRALPLLLAIGDIPVTSDGNAARDFAVFRETGHLWEPLDTSMSTRVRQVRWRHCPTMSRVFKSREEPHEKQHRLVDWCCFTDFTGNRQ